MQISINCNWNKTLCNVPLCWCCYFYITKSGLILTYQLHRHTSRHYCVPDLIRRLLFFVLLLLLLTEHQPDDENEEQHAQGHAHHSAGYHSHTSYICRGRENFLTKQTFPMTTHEQVTERKNIIFLIVFVFFSIKSPILNLNEGAPHCPHAKHCSKYHQCA